MPELAEWETFCLIVGGAAGALIGLQFIVVTLIAERPSLRIAEAGAAFGSPTVVHFASALLIAALIGAPWHAVVPLAALWCTAGVAGVVYTGVVVRRMRRQRAYRPEFEDWVFHAALPLLAYAVLVLSAFPAPAHLHDALFGVGAAALLLLFIGIHNAWDSIAYHVFVSRQKADADRS